MIEGFEDSKLVWETLRWLVTGCAAIYAWLIGRQSAKEKEMLELRTRLTQLEVQVKELPTAAQMTQVMLRLERIDAEHRAATKRMEDVLRPMTKSLERINDYLLQQK